jgi:pimeloyl-ACP methyl ester carboxylesterase
MKKIIPIILLIMVKINTSFAQYSVANNNAKTGSGITFQNVKTQTVNVGGRIKQPVLVANGDNDRMVPSSNTYDLSKRIPNSELIIYNDAGHGGMYQYHEAFVKSALAFLAK